MSESDALAPVPPRISWRKVGILTVLYFAQGLPFGFLIGWLPLYLHFRGMSVAKITFVMIVNFPWLLKFLWAPLADRYYWARLGRRRSWILPAQAALIGSLLVTGLVAPTLDLFGLMVALSVVNLCAATQDIGVDGLAVDLLDDHERGVGNSVQAAAYKIGMIGGGYGLLHFFNPKVAANLPSCFYAMAAAVAVAMVVPILLREPPPPDSVAELHDGKGDFSIVKLFLTLFTRQGAVVFLLMVLLAKAGDSIANPLFRVFLASEGVTRGQINDAMNLGGMIATLVGSAICGFVIMTIGRKTAFVVTVLGQGLSHLGWMWMAQQGVTLDAVWGIALAEHFVSGMLTVVVFTLMMDAVRPEVGSSQYTLLMSLYGGVGFGLGILSGSMAKAWGYGPAFGLGGGITLACLLLTWSLSSNGYLTGHRPESAS